MDNIDRIIDSDCDENFTTLDLFFSKCPEDKDPVTEEFIMREISKMAPIKSVSFIYSRSKYWNKKSLVKKPQL